MDHRKDRVDGTGMSMALICHGVAHASKMKAFLKSLCLNTDRLWPRISASEWCQERFQAERMYSTLFNLENWLMMAMSDLFFRNHVNFSDEC